MRKMRHLFILAMVILVLLALTGCGGGTKAPVANVPDGTASVLPQSSVPGYFSVDQSVSGGKDMQYINLRDIKVTKQATDTVIQMEFKEGSLLRDMVEKPTNGVPRYTTQWIPGVDRLVININGLAFWDYKVYDDELKDTPIQSIFDQTPVNDTETMLTRLYINLKSDVVYKVEEKDNFLVLSIRALPEEVKTSYYVMVNAFDEYTDGIVTDEEGLYPTRCNDKVNVTLISRPFGTEAEANAFMEQKKSSLLPKLPGKEIIVKPVKSGELPDYDEKGALTAYENATVTRQDGQEKAAPVLITNGKLLCWRPDGMAYVFVKPFFMGNTDGSGYTSYEKIYINDLATNTPTLLTEFDYSSITKAEFSGDGRYLAFLVGNDESRLLCIYDFQNSSKQVATASEAGFGADTANFTWGTGDKANTIYAITGEGNTLQLMSYTPTDSGPVVETLVENAFTDGSMGFYENKLYYSQSNQDDATKSGIFSFDVASRQIKRVCSGDYFELNAKAGAMAITKDDKEIRIYSIRSNLDKSIIKGKDVSSVVWSSDGSTLYYLLYQYDYDSANGDRFILKLYQYNTKSNESKELTDVVEGQFIQSDKSSELLMVYIYSQDNRFVPITYRITVNEN